MSYVHICLSRSCQRDLSCGCRSCCDRLRDSYVLNNDLRSELLGCGGVWVLRCCIWRAVWRVYAVVWTIIVVGIAGRILIIIYRAILSVRILVVWILGTIRATSWTIRIIVRILVIVLTIIVPTIVPSTIRPSSMTLIASRADNGYSNLPIGVLRPSVRPSVPCPRVLTV